MLELNEFANLINLNLANLAATYAQLLIENDKRYAAFSDDNRVASARKLLKAVVKACKTQTSTPLLALFSDIQDENNKQNDDPQRWAYDIIPPHPIIEIECLGQTLGDVVPNLEASKFLWQMLSEVRAVTLSTVKRNPVFVSTSSITDKVISPQQAQEALERRARQVQTSTEVAQEIAVAPALDDLFRRVVNLVRERFGYYHAHIYTLEEGNLVMQEGTGEAGRKMKKVSHKIALLAKQSLVAGAARSGEPMLVSDVSQESTWLPQPLLSETKSEIAVPIKLGDEVLGVLDVQNNTVGDLDVEDLLLLTGLCGQIAVAIDYRRAETERRQAEEQLRKLSRAVEQSASSVVITDTEGYIEYVNPKWTKTTGYTAEEAIDQHTRILKSGKTSTEEYKALWKTIIAGNEWRGEFHNKKKSGELYWESASISPIRNEAGAITHFLAIKEDITEYKQTKEALQKSEMLFRQVITSISHHVYMSEVTEEGNFLNHYISPNIEGLTGYPLEKFVEDWSFWPSVVIHPDDRELAAIQAEQLTEGQNSTLEYRLVRADDQVIWVLDSAKVERQGASKIIFGVVSDITDRKQTNEELQVSEARLRLLLNASPDPIVNYDEIGQVLYLNPAFTRTFGWSEDELLGERIDFVPEEHMAQTKASLGRLFEHGYEYGFETKRLTKNGQLLDIEINASVLYGDDENSTGAIMFFRNISERKQSQAILTKTLAETEILYGASAELNTAQSYDDILAILRRYTLLGQGAQTANLGYFDYPWTKVNQPEGADVLTRWSQIPTETFISRYLIADFPSSDQLLRPDEPVLVEDIATDSRLDEMTRSIYLDRFKAKSTLFVPLVVAGQWIGYANATYGQLTTFPESDVRRLMALMGQAAVAVQNLKNIALAEERTVQLEKLSQIETELSHATVEEDVLMALADHLSFVNADRIVLQYLDTDINDRPTFAKTVAVWEDGGIKFDDPDLHHRHTVSQFSVSKLWRDSPSEVLLISDLVTDPRVDDEARFYLSQLNVAAYATLPLRSSNRWQGLISFDWTEPHPFSGTEKFILQRLLEPIAAVVASRRAYLAQEEALFETDILFQASTDLNLVQSYDDIITALRRHTLLGQGAQNVSLNYFDRPWSDDQMPEWIEILARWTQLPQEVVSSGYPVAAFSSISQLFSAGAPTLIEDIVNDPRLDENDRALYVDRFGAKSTIFVPLVAGGQWIGFVNGIYQETMIFSEVEVRRLLALAGQAAVTVQSLQRLADTEQLARRERLLYEMSTNMRRSVNPDTILKIAVKTLGQELDKSGIAAQLAPEDKNNK